MQILGWVSSAICLEKMGLIVLKYGCFEGGVIDVCLDWVVLNPAINSRRRQICKLLLVWGPLALDL